MAGLAGLVLLLYFTSSHFQAATSDSATLVLEGQSMARGQVLLHGWKLTYASFWTSNALLDAIAISLVGLRSGLMYAGPAVVAAVAVAGGVLLAREGRRGASAVAGGTAVAALLVFATPSFAFFFVARGFHVATIAYALLAFFALRRGSFGWGWVAAVLLLAFGMLGDLMMVAYGVIPLFGAGLVAMVSARRRRTGLAESTAAVAGAAVAGLGRLAFDAIGTFGADRSVSLARTGQRITNLEHVPAYVSSLLGLTSAIVSSRGVPARIGSMDDLGWAHVFAAVLVLACLLLALVSLIAGIVGGRHEDGGQVIWRLDNVLVIGVFCSAVPFVYLAGSRGAGARYLLASAAFAIVLAGRMIARAAARLPMGWSARAAAAAGTVLALSLATGFGLAMSGPENRSPVTMLTTFLKAHGLRQGVAAYWGANLVTVASNGAVTVRAVTASNGHVRRLEYLSSASWYGDQRFQFCLCGGSGGLGPRAAIRQWGRPKHVYAVGRYRVFVWGHLLTLSGSPEAS